MAEGRADIAIVFISEAMAVKGVKLSGPLPPPLQGCSAYAAAIVNPVLPGSSALLPVSS